MLSDELRGIKKIGNETEMLSENKEFDTEKEYAMSDELNEYETESIETNHENFKTMYYKDLFPEFDADYMEDVLKGVLKMETDPQEYTEMLEQDIEMLGEAITFDPENHFLYGLRSIFSEIMGLVDEAKADFEKALSLNACEAYYQRGYFICLSKDMDRNEAVRCFSEAIKLYENFRDAYAWRGHAYKHLEQYELAIKDYSKAIDFFQYDKSYFDRACCFQEFAFKNFKNGNKLEYQNLLKKAVDDYTKSLLHSPVYQHLLTEEGRNLAIQHLNLNPSVIKEFGEKGFEALDDETIEDADTIRLVYLLSAFSMRYMRPYPVYEW